MEKDVQMRAYYNEFDPFAAAWLRELIKDELIADGEVDERSITDVEPGDLKGFTQCHFFAGIGGWSHALRLAGWADSRPVWTGSPPCQPYSNSGKKKGKNDERHLWPAFFNIIRECQPPTVFGEQVASAIRYGWFDDLQADMEAEGYAAGMAVLPAGCIGAPQKRDRLWFAAQRMAYTSSERQSGSWEMGRSSDSEKSENREIDRAINACGVSSSISSCEKQSIECGALGDSEGERCREARKSIKRSAQRDSWAGAKFVNCRDGKSRPIPVEPALFPLADGIPNSMGILRGAGNAIVPELAAEFIGAFMDIGF